jgi:hypothetical protein
LCQLLGGLQNIIIDVKRGSHASDDKASELSTNNKIQTAGLATSRLTCP